MINAVDIADNSVVIIPSKKKKELLLIKDLFNKRIKYISKEELIDGFSFSYNLQAVIYIHDIYKYTYSNAIDILDNLKLLDILGKGKSFNSSKLNELSKMLQDLYDHNLLKRDSLFRDLLNNKIIYIYGYSKDDLDIYNILKVNGITNINYVNSLVNYKNNSVKLYKFNTIEDEVLFVFNKISELYYNDNSCLDKIYIASYSSEYEELIKQYKNYYNYPIELNETKILFDAPVYKAFINDFVKTNSLEVSYNNIYESYQDSLYNSTNILANLIVKVKGIILSNDEMILLLNALSKKMILNKIHYEKAIRVINVDTVLPENAIVFMLGFNLGNYPHIYTDTMFFSDKEKDELGLSSSVVLSKIDNDITKDFILSNDITITYKEFSDGKKYIPSLLIDELGLKELQADVTDVRYYNKLVKPLKAQPILEFSHYKELNEKYNEDIPYNDPFEDEEKDSNFILNKKFNYHFSGFLDEEGNPKVEINFKEKDPKTNIIKNKNGLSFSVSSLETYFGCPFKYYLDKILGLGDFEDKFSTRFGSFAHRMFEENINKYMSSRIYTGNNFEDPFDVKYIEQEIDKEFTDKRERVLARNCIKQLLEANQKNIELEHNIKGFKAFAEAKPGFIEGVGNPKNREYFDLDGTGILLDFGIDKIILDTDKKCYAVIDYKTYDKKFDDDLFDKGISIQLPLYTVFADDILEKNGYKDYKCIGFFYQTTLYSLSSYINPKTLLYYLNGRTFDLDTLHDYDPYLKVAKIYATGDYIKADVKDSYDLLQMQKDVKDKVKQAYNDIKNCKFDVHPFYEDDSSYNNACKFCEYNDICLLRKDRLSLNKILEQKENE